MNFETALRLARQLILYGSPIEEAALNPAIPTDYQDAIRQRLHEEETLEMLPLGVIAENQQQQKWLNNEDRSRWNYWPRLRDYLINFKDWPLNRVASLDDSTDKILTRLSHPETQQFEKRGLVLGYVQSGKTANYSALAAKAADVGYRLFIVLTGMDNGLRRQIQLRLKAELIGYPKDPGRGVAFLGSEKQWSSFTSEDWDGDFDAGSTNPAVLLHGPPGLMVIKKNAHVLRRLIRWLNEAQTTVNSLPLLLIDDESDQASIDTLGTYQREGEELPGAYEEPSTINRLIRELLNIFQRQVYIAYTATPFANILIPCDAYNPEVGNDLYPKDFILDLPRAPGYFGAEELFGASAFDGSDDDSNGLDVIRIVPREEAEELIEGNSIPDSLRAALLDFILAGAAKSERIGKNEPATMLIHTTHRIEQQNDLHSSVERLFQDLRNDWRYNRREEPKSELEIELADRWTKKFQRVTNDIFPDRVISYEQLKDYICPFFESVKVKVINSDSEEILDYEERSDLKTIVIGGNKLSRGLTLEGLLVSYFVRNPTQIQYDTLMQMARWFGYREGYQDLTRIYMTENLADKFSHLALVEERLREDLSIYKHKGVTPEDIGMRVLTHPSMLVTNPLKQRFAYELNISYSGKIFQTFKFPLDQPEKLVQISEENLQIVRKYLETLGQFNEHQNYPLWQDVRYQLISEFLNDYDFGLHEDEKEEIMRYIDRRSRNGELVKWTVAIRKRLTSEEALGDADWGEAIKVQQMRRTRKRGTNSLGVITSPGDETIGLTEDLIDQARQFQMDNNVALNVAARQVRPAEEGVLLFYPISKYSKPPERNSGNRVPLFDNPDDPQARDLIGIAISFPNSVNERPEEYVQGRPGWVRERAE